MNKKETSILEELSKDIKEIKDILKNPKGLLDGEKRKQYNPNDPATDSQIWRIKQIGIEIPEGLTKGEASKIIQEHFDGTSNRKEVDNGFPNY